MNIFEKVMYFCDAKLNFQHHYFSITSDTSEFILIYWFASLIIWVFLDYYWCSINGSYYHQYFAA